MNRNRIIRIIALSVLALFIGLQFFPIDTSQPRLDKKLQFSEQTQIPQEIHHILKKACYDCHSFEVRYPWYSRISPVSYFLKKHVDKGIRHLNYSEWGKLSKGNQKGLLEESIHEIEKGKMPMWTYTLFHPDSKLNIEEKELLKTWLKQITKQIPDEEEFDY